MKTSQKRRDFLKLAGLSSLAYPIGTLGANGISKPIFGSSEFVPTVCEMCSSRCQIEAKVTDGKNIFIQGNPNGKANTAVCARGGAGVSQLYDPKRLVNPLIRVGERGEGKWREATWDEALTLIANKFKEIKEKYGPQSVIFSSKSCETHLHMKNFASLYGSPNVFSHVSVCPVSEKIALGHVFGTSKLGRDYSHSKYVINFGHNLFEGINISNTRSLASFAANRNTKLVVLEPRFSCVAAKADEWHPIKPGTDIAFVFALLHVWLRDGKYNKKFVEKYCIGLDEIKESLKDKTPAWAEGICEIPAKDIERIANEAWKAAPQVIIDWGHKTTTTRAEYMRTKAIAIANALMGNLDVVGGISLPKKAKTYNALAGENIIPGITNPDSHIKQPKSPRIDGAGEKGKNCFVSRSHGVAPEIADAILNKKPYEVKAWFNTRFNPLINVCETNKTIKAIKSLDFVVAMDIYINDFAYFADVILPESTYLERDEGIMDKSGKKPAYQMRQKVVEPIGNTRSAIDIFVELAKRLKIDNYKWKGIKGYRMAQAKGNDKLLASLIKKGFVSFDVPGILYRDKASVAKFIKRFPNHKAVINEDGDIEFKLSTPSGKIELFCQKVEDAFPEFGALNTKNIDVFHGHKFCLTSGKTPVHTNAHTQNVPELQALMNENDVWISTNSAKKLGIKSGDKIRISNEISSQIATALVTKAIRDDTIFAYHGFGHISKSLTSYGIGLNDSALLSNKTAPVCSSMVTNIGVDIAKA